jgi:hypothetical protein
MHTNYTVIDVFPPTRFRPILHDAIDSQESLEENIADLRSRFPETPPPSIASAINAELSTWPTDEERTKAYETLRQMDEPEVEGLVRLAADSFEFTKPDRGYGPGLPVGTETKKLMERGLAEKIPGWKLAILTPAGRRLARLFTAQGSPPPGTPPELLQLRERYADLAKQTVVINPVSMYRESE